MTHKQNAGLTFKDNIQRGRHGWVRLTPAYSVNIVQQILDEHPDVQYIFEPFSGTGTTGLVAAQRGLHCDLCDINPFLIWLADVKCANYTSAQLEQTEKIAAVVINQVLRYGSGPDNLWLPALSNIDRWWSQARLMTLAKVFHAINQLFPTSNQEKDLLLIAFCRLLIRWSNAAFNHPSMSFKHNGTQQHLFDEEEMMLHGFLDDVNIILQAARENIAGKAQTFLSDSRYVKTHTTQPYDAVITSPPYANRMSYIRELRPYMFWLGYLHKASDAGELDWKAIGGTWGIATSRLNSWNPENTCNNIPHLMPLVQEIAQSSNVLARYVEKYFTDMSKHFANLYNLVASGGQLFYIIGNSKFYDTLVSTEQLYADLMKSYGFEDIHIKPIRKRNSKKELFEYLVTARKP